MAGVLRHLGVPYTGGAHAHLRRRIDALGIDTSHFLGRAHNRGRPAARRLDAPQILVLRDRERRRARPELLRRALAETGLAWRCAACGLGPFWNGRPLTLQVDHRNGDHWDCRPGNLRLLCPNCHSQTPTYAGRNRRLYGVRRHGSDEPSQPCPDPSPGGSEPEHPAVVANRPGPRSEEEVLTLIRRVDGRELTVTQAARIIGCHRNHFYRLRRRFEESGSLASRPGGRRWRTDVLRDRVIAYALAHPEQGPRTIARRLGEGGADGCSVSHGTVSNILRAAGLNTVAARRSRLVAPAGVV